MQWLITTVQVNPTLEFAESLIPPEGTTEIIVQRGGSAIDVGKWVAKKHNLKLTVIPTTAGTGSEVTNYCVLTTDGKKKTYIVPKPNSYVLDPRLVVGLPPLQTLASGMDALSQALESLWSKNATRESKLYSKVAIKLIFKALPICLKYPEDELARMDMLIAANFSGRAINITKTNVCHAISYPLTDIYNIPHGIACAMSLRYFAKKALGLDLSKFIKLPKYDFDINIVADEAIKSDKLHDCKFTITREDIVKSLYE